MAPRDDASRPVALLLALLGTIFCPGLAGAAAPERVEVLRGTVQVEQDGRGRLVVLLERADGEHPGLLDDVFICEAREPLAVQPARLESAIVLVSGNGGVDRLVVRTADGREVLRVGVGGNGAEPGLRPLVALAHWNALALAAATSSDPSFEGLAVEEVPLVIDGGEQPSLGHDDSDCAAGGPGATECRADCARSFLGISIGSSCGVTCGDGHYACCDCTGLFGESGRCSCKTVKPPEKEVEPRWTTPPGGHE